MEKTTVGRISAAPYDMTMFIHTQSRVAYLTQPTYAAYEFFAHYFIVA